MWLQRVNKTKPQQSSESEYVGCLFCTAEVGTDLSASLCQLKFAKLVSVHRTVQRVKLTQVPLPVKGFLKSRIVPSLNTYTACVSYA